MCKWRSRENGRLKIIQLDESMWHVHTLAVGKLSGHIQDQECTQCLGTCRALMYLQGVTQGEQVPAECLSRSVIMYKSKYIHGGLYLSVMVQPPSFLSVFVCPLPHLHHLPTPSDLIHLPSTASTPTPR